MELARAPRVTLVDLEANIAHTEFVKHVSHSGKVLRWCVITTQNGFACVGDPSVAVSAANDVEEEGKRVALDNSRDRLWALMGYELSQRLHEKAKAERERLYGED